MRPRLRQFALRERLGVGHHPRRHWWPSIAGRCEAGSAPAFSPRIQRAARERHRSSAQSSAFSVAGIVKACRHIASVQRGPSGAGQAPNGERERAADPKSCNPRDRRHFSKVGETGFEPATPWSRTKCSTRLSHSPVSLWSDSRRLAFGTLGARKAAFLLPAVGGVKGSLAPARVSNCPRGSRATGMDGEAWQSVLLDDGPRDVGDELGSPGAVRATLTSRSRPPPRPAAWGSPRSGSRSPPR